MQRIGVLGVGELTEKVVIGLRRSGFEGEISLSPRNKERATALADAQACTVMDSNQGVADRSDVLILGVRPDAVESVASEITLRPDQTLVSLVAGMQTAELKRLFRDVQVTRAMLSYAAQINQSTVVLYPASTVAEPVLARVGTLVVLNTEAQFELATVAACMNGWFYFFLNDLQQWFVSNGLEPEQALELVTSNMQDCLATIQNNPGQSLESIGNAIATPGTYTAAGLDVLKQRRSGEIWSAASEDVLKRLTQADE